MNRMHWYTVYKAATDEVVAAGPAETVYRQLGMSSENSLYSAVSRSRDREAVGRKRWHKYDFVVEELGVKGSRPYRKKRARRRKDADEPKG